MPYQRIDSLVTEQGGDTHQASQQEDRRNDSCQIGDEIHESLDNQRLNNWEDHWIHRFYPSLILTLMYLLFLVVISYFV